MVGVLDEPIVIRMRHEPEPHAQRLLDAIGASWIIDPDAPRCARHHCRRCDRVTAIPAHELVKTRICSAPGCELEAATGRQLCSEHIQRAAREPLTPVERETIALIRRGKTSPRAVAKERRISEPAAYECFRNLVRKGQIVRVEPGVYALTTEPGREPQASAQGGRPAAGPVASAEKKLAAPPSRPDVPDRKISVEFAGKPSPPASLGRALVIAARAFADALEAELA
jgi:hypothetical protein